MQKKIEEIFKKDLQELSSVLGKLENEKVNLIVIRKFTQSMYSKEKNRETKIIFKEIISYIDRTIEAIARVEKELPDKVKGAAVSITSDIVQLVTEELPKEMAKQIQGMSQNNYK